MVTFKKMSPLASTSGKISLALKGELLMAENKIELDEKELDENQLDEVSGGRGHRSVLPVTFKVAKK
jgi:hypothetical protein